MGKKIMLVAENTKENTYRVMRSDYTMATYSKQFIPPDLVKFLNRTECRSEKISETEILYK